MQTTAPKQYGRVEQAIDLPTGGQIPLITVQRVEELRCITINQTTAGQTATLPDPIDTGILYSLDVLNIGTETLIMYGTLIIPGSPVRLSWSGTAWGSPIADLEARLAALELHTSAEVMLSSLNVETHSNIAAQDKINATTPILPIGEYKYTVDFAFNHDSTNTSFRSQFQVDGVAVSFTGDNNIQYQESKDSAGTAAQQTAAGIGGTGTTQKYAFSKSFLITHATAATHDVRLRWHPAQAGTNSSIWDAYVFIKKVGFVP